MTTPERSPRVRQQESVPELALRRVLWANGLRYRLKSDLPGRPDLVFPRQRLAIFVDGCFWHGCPIHFTQPKRNADFWREKIERNRARDRRNYQRLLAMDWRVIRVWEHDVHQASEGAAAAIASALDNCISLGAASSLPQSI